MKKKLITPSCQQLIDSFPEPFVIIDRDYNIVSANTRYARHYGVQQPRELAGRHCYEVSHHLDSPCSQHGEHCPLEELFRSGETIQVMHVHFDAKGNEERVQINASPLFDEQGRLQFMGESITVLQEIPQQSPVIGQSKSMRLVLEQVKRVAPTRTTVLLTGESGTGKECIARFLHTCSGRQDKPFVVVDCAAMGGSNVIDRELFGAEADPSVGRQFLPGLFERAAGGTLLIDEVGELPLTSQNRLLRALESREIKRVGGADYQPIDTRVVVSSSRDLKAMVAEGSFRKDLYYRLSAFPVHVPPLRERGEDLVLLARHFIGSMEHEGDAVPDLDDSLCEALCKHDYPGNVRELRNVIERAVIYAAGDPIGPEHLVFDSDMFGAEEPRGVAAFVAATMHAGLISRRGRTPSDEEVMEVLAACEGHRAQAALQLGVSERTLYRHLKRLRLRVPRGG